jgi:hypothetical protein
MDATPSTAWLANLSAGVPNWLLGLSPFVAAILTWRVAVTKHQAERHAADRQYQLELRKARQDWDAKVAERQQQEKALMHTENAEQTKAWTERFTVLMDGYDSRVGDLMKEVAALRKEVISLRRIIDWQRQECVGCPKLVKFFSEQSHGAS